MSDFVKVETLSGFIALLEFLIEGVCTERDICAVPMRSYWEGKLSAYWYVLFQLERLKNEDKE